MFSRNVVPSNDCYMGQLLLQARILFFLEWLLFHRTFWFRRLYLLCRCIAPVLFNAIRGTVFSSSLFIFFFFFFLRQFHFAIHRWTEIPKRTCNLELNPNLIGRKSTVWRFVMLKGKISKEFEKSYENWYGFQRYIRKWPVENTWWNTLYAKCIRNIERALQSSTSRIIFIEQQSHNVG